MIRPPKSTWYYATVFVTGAIVLVIEVAATRILSPYFGNTIYTVSSVITVVLAALSIGYALGGRLADRFPNAEMFFALIAASGASVALLSLLMQWILPAFGYAASPISGPLWSSLLLFFLPAFLLGTLSPFSIKLIALASPEQGIGTVSGTVFFWSTTGSIVGSLLTGFSLIPTFGLRAIVLGCAITLVLIGGAGWMISKRCLPRSRNILACLLLFAGTSLPLPKPPGLLYSQDGVYEHITIYDGMYRERPVRFFMQDRSSSGAMPLAGTEPAYDYTRYADLAKIFTPNAKRALVIGGGIYTIPSLLLQNLPDASVDVAEIEPRLFDLAKTYFRLEDTPRLQTHIADGRRFLHDTTEPYDFIFGDAYNSLYSIPSHLTTQEFFTLASSKLTNNGVFLLNVIGSLETRGGVMLRSEQATLRSVFPHVLAFGVNDPASPDIQNFILAAFKQNPPTISDSYFASHLADISLEDAMILTDDFAPTDRLGAYAIAQQFTR